MHIRSFQNTDSSGVKSLVTSIMNKEFAVESKAYQYGDLDNISEAYNNIRDKFLVAEESANVIGTAGIKEDSESNALLRRLFVHPSHRGRGVGSMLVDTAIDFCKMSKYKTIVFRATNRMGEAITLLTAKKGFVEKERHMLDGVEIIILQYKIH